MRKKNVNNEVNSNFHGCTVLLQGVLQMLQVLKVIIYRLFSWTEHVNIIVSHPTAVSSMIVEGMLNSFNWSCIL